jgi:hypothetical protein
MLSMTPDKQNGTASRVLAVPHQGERIKPMGIDCSFVVVIKTNKSAEKFPQGRWVRSMDSVKRAVAREL